jgi:hypothetical protein
MWSVVSVTYVRGVLLSVYAMKSKLSVSLTCLESFDAIQLTGLPASRLCHMHGVIGVWRHLASILLRKTFLLPHHQAHVGGACTCNVSNVAYYTAHTSCEETRMTVEAVILHVTMALIKHQESHTA